MFVLSLTDCLAQTLQLLLLLVEGALLHLGLQDLLLLYLQLILLLQLAVPAERGGGGMMIRGDKNK